MENHWKALFSYPEQTKTKFHSGPRYSRTITDDGQLVRRGKHYYSHYVSYNNERIYITERQHNCLALYQNKTMKQIATQLQLSPRTVESYLLQLKRKLNCHYKRELAQYVTKLQTVN